MTFFGKTLVFLNLIFGIGAAICATSLYANRPGWFADPKEGPAPMSFGQLAADIESQGKSAGSANVNWSTNYKALAAAEASRDSRYARMYGGRGKKGLIELAQEGNPDGPAFLNLVEDPSTRLLDLDTKSAVKGPDDKLLNGTDTLLTKFTDDAAKAEIQANLSKKHRVALLDLAEKIKTTQEQIYKQEEIRNNLVVEAARLEAFEVNATEHMQIATRRRNQLIGRLAPFRSFFEKK